MQYIYTNGVSNTWLRGKILFLNLYKSLYYFLFVLSLKYIILYNFFNFISPCLNQKFQNTIYCLSSLLFHKLAISSEVFSVIASASISSSMFYANDQVSNLNYLHCDFTIDIYCLDLNLFFVSIFW